MKEASDGYEKNTIYISFKALRTILYNVIVLLGFRANMPGNDKQ